MEDNKGENDHEMIEFNILRKGRWKEQQNKNRFKKAHFNTKKKKKKKKSGNSWTGSLGKIV